MGYRLEDRYKIQYFTGTQASMWIGDIWVEEVFGISFSATQNLVPIFGYASSFFDAIGRGKSLVQGSFEINFVDEGYLYYILHKRNSQRAAGTQEFNKSQYILTGTPPVSDHEVVQRIDDLMQSKEQILTAKEYQEASVSVLDKLYTLNVNEVDKVIKELDIRRKVGAEAGLRNNKKSVIYDVIPFSIQGIFGNPDFTEEVTEKRIENCFLVSNEMILAQDDQPIKERYSFIAQSHK